MSTEKGQRSCLNRCPLDKLTSSDARTNRKDQSAVRTGRIGPCVADIGIDVGNAQSQHPVAGLRAYGPAPVLAALRTGARGEDRQSVVEGKSVSVRVELGGGSGIK